jgi:hypothetical protein
MGRPAVDLTGQVFGRLTVLHRGPSAGRKARWVVRCECGTEKVVSGSSLRAGGTVSCGCARRERMSARGAAHPAHRSPLVG